MKKMVLIVTILFLIPMVAGAVVYENDKSGGESIAPGITGITLNSAGVRMNGKNVDIKRYESREPVKKILEAYLAKAEKEGSRLINNQYFWLAATTLFKAAGSGDETGSFGYIFIVDKNDTAVFVIAGASGNSTKIIKSEIMGYSSGVKGGYDDGLNHFSGAKRVLSIEFLSDGRTVNFGNFYSIAAGGRLEIRNYYSGEFKRTGLKVLKKDYAADADRYILKGEKRELVVNISEQENGEFFVFVMG